MQYLSVFDRESGQRLAFLQNAYRIGYTLSANGLSTATFSMPASDPKNQYCQPFHFVELFDGDRRVELFRILPSVFTRSADTCEYVYQCEQVIATLMDDVLFGWHEVGNLGTNTQSVLRYLLERQAVKRWQLNECAFSHQYLYGWENENLLSALFSVPNSFVERYLWAYDTTTTPWTISLKQWDDTVKGEIRYQKNMTGITKTVDPQNLTTRLYCLGYGEGMNQLTIGDVPYLDATTQGQYGMISKIWVDRRYQDQKSLLDAGKAMLEELQTPYVSYTVQALALHDLQNIQVGDTVRVIDDEDGISFLAPVIGLSKQDVTGDNAAITVTIANKAQDVATTLANLSDRQRIADLYSQGSVNIDSHDFADNADASNPAAMRFYIPVEAIRINAVRFTWRTAPFRSYSKGVNSAPASAQTSSSGGGSADTTRSGGGTSTTSGQSGGKTTLEDTSVASGSGTSHRHNFWLPKHEHSVRISSHSHDIDLPDHTHSFTVPAHMHDMQHGIFTGSQASAVKVLVDGKEIPADNLSNDLDISGYLSTDDAGRILRSAWHTVQVVPNSLTRIEASLQMTLFINPKGGKNL